MFSILGKLAEYVIMPDSWFGVFWERVVLSVLLFICYVYTFIASFSISLHALGYGKNIFTQVLLVVTYVLDTVLVGDFILRFNMASETITGIVISTTSRQRAFSFQNEEKSNVDHMHSL